MKDSYKKNEIDYAPNPLSDKDAFAAFEKTDTFKNLFLKNKPSNLEELLIKLTAPVGKKSFLVFKYNKYFTVPTESIAFFHIKLKSSLIRCFDQQEYEINYSMDQIQQLLTGQQFFRLNRQYLINFQAVKEVEHYFARKLFVKLTVPITDKLFVSKEKASRFLQWLDNR